MYNKSEAYPCIKVEKENKNIKVRKTIKSLNQDKNLANKNETVWDRLSKVKTTLSDEKVLGTTKARFGLSNKTSQHFQMIRQSSSKHSMQPVLKLSPTTRSFNHKRSSLPKKGSMKKPTFVAEINGYSLFHDSTTKENINSRRLSENSKCSSEIKATLNKFANKPQKSLRSIDQIVMDSSEDSNEEYKLAPLMNSRFRDFSKNRTTSLHNGRETLQYKNKSMELVNLKSKISCENFDTNSKTLEDIFKTRSKNVWSHEFVVKKALESLDSSAKFHQNNDIESTRPSNKIVSYSGPNKETQKFEVDVIFKNVPSLGKEIEILRALGEKLESTLKTTMPYRNRHDVLSQSSIVPTSTPSLFAEKKNPPLILRVIYEVYDFAVECYVQESVRLIGTRHFVGIANEFQVAQKTIIELKSDLNRPFYIKSNSESVDLIKTTFEKLKETPNEFLRHVKPKNARDPFNFLEQDPVFFYNAFYKRSNMSLLSSTKCKHYQKYNLPITEYLYGACDTQIWKTISQKALQNNVNQVVDRNVQTQVLKSESVGDIKNKLPIFEPLIRGKQRRRIRRCVTPMPNRNYNSLKISLFKTILIGIVQMSTFIIFIMALTHPDVKCKKY